MSELDLLADCLKDTTKERDDLAAALVQKQTVIDEMLESLDEAKFTEPELRAKLDKQRQRIDQLEAALHPGKQACDCCTRQTYQGETFWMIECQCGNHDDLGRAQAWCSMANSYEGATGKSVTAGDSRPDDGEMQADALSEIDR